MNAAHHQTPRLALELKQFADTAPVILWMTDPSGACVFLSRGWYESTGQVEQEALGIGWLKVVHPEDREKSGQIFREANAARRPFTLDYRLRQSNGEYRWAIDSGNPRFDERGEFLGFVGSVIDIHERVLARQSLQESEARYKSVLGLMPAGLYTVESATGKITYYNDQAARLWGREPKLDDAEDRFCGSYKVFLPDGRFVPRDQTPMALAIREGRSFRNTEAIVERPDGSRLTALVNVDPLRDADGRVIGAVNVLYDISDRRAAEQALERSEERYRHLVESQSEMLCRFRPDGTILFVNGAYARARGSTAEAMHGQNFWKFIPAEDHPGVRAMLEGLTPENPEARVEHRFETAEGSRWTLWINRALTFDEQGRAIELQSTGVDITERRRAEDELLEADRRKDEFLAILSHELRNPLAPIRNHVARLRASGGEPGVLDEALPVLDRQVAHLVRLVDDLLDVARINRGDIVLQKRAVPLAEIVTTALETSRPLLEARGHRLSVQLPGKPVIVMGDPVRLSQVLANVLNNAATYTPAGGKIDITVDTEQDRGVLRVRDNGPGFTPATGQHMFELFMRGEDARNHPAGFGIGLALARRLIEMHGGTIRAESAGPNQGSEFFITLPIERTAAVTQDAAPDRARPSHEKKILVVDDNVDAADSLALLLSASGADTTAVYDGRSALKAFAELQPDVVLLDIGMPGMDGYEVARSIREQWPQSGVTLVALTGWGQEEDRQRTAAAGFDHHLVKPAGFEEIEAILSKT